MFGRGKRRAAPVPAAVPTVSVAVPGDRSPVEATATIPTQLGEGFGQATDARTAVGDGEHLREGGIPVPALGNGGDVSRETAPTVHLAGPSEAAASRRDVEVPATSDVSDSGGQTVTNRPARLTAAGVSRETLAPSVGDPVDVTSAPAAGPDESAAASQAEGAGPDRADGRRRGKALACTPDDQVGHVEKWLGLAAGRHKRRAAALLDP